MANVLIILIILLLSGAAAGYIVKEKKKGVKCIGCPSSGTCSRKHQTGCGCGNR